MFKINLSESAKMSLFTAIRQIFYFLAILAFVMVINFIAGVYKKQTFSEYGIVENMQLVLLVITSVLFLLNAVIKINARQLFLMLAAISFFASIRECDMFFDKHLPIISWKFAWILPLAALVYASLNFLKTREQIFKFITSPAFNMMVAAIIIVVPIAQCVGHRSLVVNALEYNDLVQIREVKQFFEECVEFIGYFVLLLSAVECCWFSADKK